MAVGIVVMAVAAYLATHLAAFLVARAAWPLRYPALAIVVWVNLLAGAVCALLTLAITALASPPGPLHTWVEHLRSCLPGHTHTGELAAGAVALVLGGILVMVSYRGIARVSRTVAERRRHHEMVQLIARCPEEPGDVCVIEHPAPVVYCLPMRSRPIILTTGALRQLAPEQVDAVLEHERAHLRRRHHLLLALVDALHTALSWSGTVRLARTELPGLIEMVADDDAARRHGPGPVIGALHTLAIAPCPVGGLGAQSHSADGLARRIVRLESAVRAPRRLPRFVDSTLLLPLPLLLLVAGIVQLTC